jgi:hypothetical protein
MTNGKLTPEKRHSAYLTLQNIRQRCTNENNKHYCNEGAVGIECQFTQEEFTDFLYRTDRCEKCGNNLNDKNRKKADGRTIDRIDTTDNYSENNCRVVCGTCARGNGKPRELGGQENPQRRLSLHVCVAAAKLACRWRHSPCRSDLQFTHEKA